MCFRTLENIKDWLTDDKVGLILDGVSSNQDQNDAYKYLIHRTLGYMAHKKVDLRSNITNHEKLVGTTVAVVGENPKAIALNPKDPKNIISIFWSQIQLGVLQSKHSHVILAGDYGTGKTFLLKVIIQYSTNQVKLICKIMHKKNLSYQVNYFFDT